MVGPNLCCIPSSSLPVGYRVVLSHGYRGLVAKWAPCPCRGYGVGHGHVECERRARRGEGSNIALKNPTMALWKWLFPSGKKPEDCPFCILASGSVEDRTPNVLFQVRILRHCCRLTQHFSALLCLVSLRDVWWISFREGSEGRKHVTFCSVCVFLGMFWCFILFTMSLRVWDSAITVEANRNSRE